ncbi:MAG: hypothetical protein KDD98_10825 [Sphingomonadaceae bacterium]|nr:hypothetical protein [Sphingomonadaceae bacterium]
MAGCFVHGQGDSGAGSLSPALLAPCPPLRHTTRMNVAGFPCHYHHSGLRFASMLELPEWSGFACDDAGQVDVSILFDPHGQPAGPPDYAPEYSNGALRFAIPETGCWTIREGREIAVVPVAGAQERELRLFTLGSAWGALGYQRGFAMLHGSAVKLEQGALLFCGDQGHGKSTMAAAMQARGHGLLADDLSRVDAPAAGGKAMLHPTATRVKLWDSAIAQLGLQDRPREQDHFRDAKFHLPLDGGIPPTDPVPLAGAMVLEWGEDIVVERLSGSAAVTALMQATMYRKAFLQAMELLTAQLAMIARIASATPVWRLTRPRDFTRLEEVCARVEGCLRA